MTRSILFCVFALAGCGDNLTPETSEEPPPDAGPPDAVPPPEADGEYLIKVSPVSFTCYGEPQQAEIHITLADVVPQEDPWKFDLLSGPDLKGTFVQYDRWNLPWDAEGFFSNERTDTVDFGFGITAKAKRFLEGSVGGGSLNFFHSFDLGIFEQDDS